MCGSDPLAHSRRFAPHLLPGPIPGSGPGQRLRPHLGADYQRLKRRKCPACARFGSDLHVLLRVLGMRSSTCRSLPKRVLGRPDRVRSDALIYYWHGEHDYLYFRVGADRRGRSAWYHAYA